MTDRDASLREAARLEDAHGAGDPYAAALRATRMPIVITDALQDDNPIVFANQAFIDLSGYAREEIIGRNCRFMQGPDTDRSEVARIAAAIKAGENVVAEILNYRKDGTTFWNALYVSPVFDDDGRINHFFGSQLDVTARNRAAIDLREANVKLERANEELEQAVQARTRDLQRALDQKTAALHEIDHRVKNNLQLIASLILLQTRRIREPAARQGLKETLARVTALATVHRTLLQVDDVTSFDVSAFIRDLVNDLVGATGRDDLSVEFDLAPLLIEADRAAPLALMINEIVGNAIKHGLGGQAGLVRLATRPEGETIVIEIADDGVGRPPEGETVGFGQTLIELLGKQLSAEIETRDARPGTSVRVTMQARPARADAESGKG